MPKDRAAAGACAKCATGQVTCSHNRFVDEDENLRIDSWEHRCSDCDYRDTHAVRSDDEDAAELDPNECPICRRRVTG